MRQGCLFGKAADLSAEGVDLDEFQAFPAPQNRLAQALNPPFADLIVQTVTHLPLMLIGLRVDQSDISDDMRRKRGAAVEAEISPAGFILYFHTRQIVAFFFHDRHDVESNVSYQSYRLVHTAVSVFEFSINAQYRHARNLAEPVDHAPANRRIGISTQSLWKHGDGV